jgi:hypothetical protein
MGESRILELSAEARLDPHRGIRICIRIRHGRVTHLAGADRSGSVSHASAKMQPMVLRRV